MHNATKPRVHVGKAVRILLSELGLDHITVLRSAGLPPGVLDGNGSHIKLDTFFDLWSSVTDQASDPLLALKLGDASGIDYFDPAFFAAMCSPNMNVAAQRLADYKRLVSPFTFDIKRDDDSTEIAFVSLAGSCIHPTMALTEIVFLVNFVRRATRYRVVPLSISLPFNVPEPVTFGAHFGCSILNAQTRSVTFSASDAERTFLTHDDEIWDLFEPKLRRQIDRAVSTPETRAKVSHCLNELLPSGRATVEEVARELAMSKRTLQRRLSDEGTNWLEVLNEAREALAKHYLKTTDYGAAEVSFLLGFADPNSFFRAFRRWEKTTPELWREKQQSQSETRH